MSVAHLHYPQSVHGDVGAFYSLGYVSVGTNLIRCGISFSGIGQLTAPGIAGYGVMMEATMSSTVSKVVIDIPVGHTYKPFYSKITGGNGPIQSTVTGSTHAAPSETMHWSVIRSGQAFYPWSAERPPGNPPKVNSNCCTITGTRSSNPCNHVRFSPDDSDWDGAFRATEHPGYV